MVLRRWTREHRIIQQFDTTLAVHATLLSWEFRWAHTVAVSSMFRLTATEKKQLWAREQQDLNQGVSFVVAAASSDNILNDLEKGTPDLEGSGRKSSRSHWRITLEVDRADPVLPMEIKLIEPITKLHRRMFPHAGHFHRLYLVRFPRRVGEREVLPHDARIIRLRFTGSPGAARLIWHTTNVVVSE